MARRDQRNDRHASLNHIKSIVDDCLVRRAKGEPVSDESVVAAHPDLMPELGEWLYWLRVINGVDRREAGSDAGNAPEMLDRHRSSVQTRCPHCHNQIKLASDAELSDVKCPSCGSSFNLLGQETDDNGRKGTTIAHYRFLDEIGVGAFGSVWSAHDTQLDRIVAVKIPRKGQLNPTETEQFLREARSAAQLTHANIVSVHEVGREGGQVYIVSDYVDGRTLADLLADEQTNAREAAELCIKLAKALQHAHDAGVVHRDVKPTNIIVDRKGEPYLMDFGLAKREVGEVTMTMDGNVLGTPAYMSPEQAKGNAHRADPRSDVYSLGVVYYECLTGRRPFEANVRTLLEQVMNDEPPSPRKWNSYIPRDLETICLKCLEKTPVRRYQTAQALADDLSRWMNKEPIVARPIGKVGRGVRWCQRRPMIAALIGAVIAVTCAGFGGVAWQWRKATQAERQSYRNAYAADMLVAQRALADNNLGLAKALLDRYKPARGEPDVRGFEWRYLWQQTRGDDLPPVGKHDYNILGLAIAPDGQRLASADGFGGGEVRIWDLRTKQMEVVQPAGAVGTIAFGPDGRRIAYGARAGDGGPSNVIVRNLADGKSLTIPALQTERFSALRFLPDGRLAVADVHGQIRIWNLPDDGPPTSVSFGKREPWVTCLESAPNNPSILAAVYSTMTGGELRFWDLSSKLDHKPAIDSIADPQSIAFTPDGRQLVCGHLSSGGQPDSTIFVLDTETGDSFHLTGHPGRVWCVAISHDGNQMATAGVDHTIRLWDTSDWKVTDVLRGHLNEVSCLVFSPDDHLLYSGGKDGVIRAWNTRPEKKRGPVLVPFNETWRASAISWNGSAFAVVEKDGQVNVWNVLTDNRDQARLPNLQKTEKGHLPFAVSNNGRWVATVLENGSFRVWDLESDKQLTVESADDSRIAKIEFSPVGDSLFALRMNGQLERISLPTANYSTLLAPQKDAAPASSISFANDGQRIAIGRVDGAVRVWRFDDGELAVEWNEWEPHLEYVERVVFLPDNRTIVTCGRDAYVKFWDVASREELTRFNPVRDAFFSIAASPDGKLLAAGSASGEVHLWHVDSQQHSVLDAVCTTGIHRIAIPDANTLVCTDYGTGLVVLRVPSWAEIEAEESK